MVVVGSLSSGNTIDTMGSVSVHGMSVVCNMRLCIARMDPVEMGGHVILQKLQKYDSDVAPGANNYGVAYL